jgi:hypothetical protein
MKRKRAFRQSALALVIIFGLGSLDAIACPMLCAARHCMGHLGNSTVSSMPSAHPCCPGQSTGMKGSVCGAPVSACLAHAQYAAFLNSPQASKPRARTLSNVTPSWIPRMSSAFSIVTYASPSPPPCSSGKTICQKASILRI